MSWEISPEPRTAAERAALTNDAAEALEDDAVSPWWQSGLEEAESLGGGPAPKQPWRGPSVVEP